MASFKICDDCNDIENVRPKQQKRECPKEKTHRTAFQPLCGYQQKPKDSKAIQGKENSVLVTKFQKEESALESDKDVICLKPVVKKVGINSKVLVGSIEKDYEEGIWTYLNYMEKKMFKIKPNYMRKQQFLNWDMRSVLIDWLVSVADEYQMSNHTIHLSVNYLDRFLSSISVIREKFQLVGATAMLLAGKMEEIYPPVVKEWAYLTGDTFTPRQILKMEQLMLKVLNFEMNAPTTLDFIKHLCAKHKMDNKTMYLAMYLSELVLLEGEDYLQHFPSKLAAACLVLARHTLFKSQPWTKKLEETAGYSLKQLSPVVQKQQKTFKSSPFKEQQSIQKKYASDKYQRVALLKPRMLILDDEE